MNSVVTSADPLTEVLATYRLPEKTDFADAWVGMEPTFQSKKSVRKWAKLSQTPEGEDAYFEDEYLLRKQRKVAKTIRARYRTRRAEGGHPGCFFDDVDLEQDRDQWKVRRQTLIFRWADRDLEPFKARFSIDPETFEYTLKPVPLAWFYDARFVAFLEEFIWGGPLQEGLTPSIGHGGGQFSFSAKTFLGGSLLADDVAYKVNHPELANWIMDYPNCDDRSFRATKARFSAFRDLIGQYWAGAFHPKAVGTLTVENAYLDRGFGPAASPRRGLMNAKTGPTGSPRDVFQTNFAFGRAVRLFGQNVHPGYWQSAHPDEEGYRPDQIMRYSEGNLNRLQIAGEYHVKSGKVLDPERIPEFDAPLELSMLYEECSWENRGSMSKSSGRDFVEAVLLDANHARYLQQNPRVKIVASLLQDQLMIDGERTVRKYADGKTLARLREEARESNLAYSRGRVKSDWIEPETLFWEAWRVLPAVEKAAIAREAIGGFLERVEQAASVDPRPEAKDDPMEWHRHRVHPLLWRALEAEPGVLAAKDPVRDELRRWQAKEKLYLSRRPIWSVTGAAAPWDDLDAPLTT